MSEMSPEEQEELMKIMNLSAPVPDEKHNVHTFLHKVAISKDTTKTGFLKDEEIGMMKNPVRAYKAIALFAKQVMHNEALANFFSEESEITTSTSLSRAGFLVNKAVMNVRHLADVTPVKKENKGWFKKKDSSSDGTVVS